MRDRFTRGFVAGVVAGIPTFVVNWGSRALGLSRFTWSDVFSALVYGRLPTAVWEEAFAVFGVYLFLSFLGAVFALLVPALSSRNHYLKGWAFSGAIWFASLSLVMLFSVPAVRAMDPMTAGFLFIGASVWGLTLAYVLGRLDQRLRA